MATLPIVDPLILYRAVAQTPAGPWHGKWRRDRAAAEAQALRFAQLDPERVWLEQATGVRSICAVLHELDAA
jgi:hypothetical protein